MLLPHDMHLCCYTKVDWNRVTAKHMCGKTGVSCKQDVCKSMSCCSPFALQATLKLLPAATHNLPVHDGSRTCQALATVSGGLAAGCHKLSLELPVISHPVLPSMGMEPLWLNLILQWREEHYLCRRHTTCQNLLRTPILTHPLTRKAFLRSLHSCQGCTLYRCRAVTSKLFRRWLDA